MNRLVARLSEGSSWAAIGSALLIFGVEIPAEIGQAFAQVVGGLALIAGFFMPDKDKGI